LSAHSVGTLFLDDFQTATGWTVSGNAVDGQWQRGVPAGGGDRGDPPGDGDGSGACYVTDNADGNSDVDDGSTILTSPLFDLGGPEGGSTVVRYYRWYSNNAGSAPFADVFRVEVSNNGGSTWTPLETVGPTGSEVTGGWFRRTWRIADFVAPTSQMRFRFIASDLGNGSVVEAGVDGFEILVVNCLEPVVPAVHKLFDGVVASGQLSNVAASDNQYFALDPTPTANPVKQKIDLVVQAISPVPAPASFEIRLESRMTGGPAGDVIQTVEFFNHDTSQYEVVDMRPATNTDATIAIDGTGDLSRFVHPVTSELAARIGLASPEFNGPPFLWSADIDELVWLIE
jgi:hypothetical protein